MQIATYNNKHSYILFQQVFISQKLLSTPIPQTLRPSSSRVLILSSSPIVNSHLLEHYKLQHCTYLLIPT
jgi:hypothetical protein